MTISTGNCSERETDTEVLCIEVSIFFGGGENSLPWKAFPNKPSPTLEESWNTANDQDLSNGTHIINRSWIYYERKNANKRGCIFIFSDSRIGSKYKEGKLSGRRSKLTSDTLVSWTALENILGAERGIFHLTTCLFHSTITCFSNV